MKLSRKRSAVELSAYEIRDQIKSLTLGYHFNREIERKDHVALVNAVRAAALLIGRKELSSAAIEGVERATRALHFAAAYDGPRPMMAAVTVDEDGLDMLIRAIEVAAKHPITPLHQEDLRGDFTPATQARYAVLREEVETRQRAVLAALAGEPEVQPAAPLPTVIDFAAARAQLLAKRRTERRDEA